MQDNRTLHSPHPFIGRILKGRYRLDERLGEGGMALVFRATHLDLPKTVAVKILSVTHDNKEADQPDEDRARFEREARLAGRFAHPHIAQVFDFGKSGDLMFLVMEYVEGQDLSALLRSEGPLSPAVAVDLLRQNSQRRCRRPMATASCTATSSAKPAAVAVSPRRAASSQGARLRAGEGSRGRPSEADPPGDAVGDADLHGPGADRHGGRGPLQRARAAAGAPGPLDGKVDLYAAGVVFYQILCGRPPFTGRMVDVLRSHLFTAPPDLPALVPAPVRDLCMKLLQKRPADRFGSAKELLQAIRGVGWRRVKNGARASAS